MKMNVRILLSLTLVMTGLQARAEERPDVPFIAIDDLNDWIGIMGGHPQARTPNIDALAERGERKWKEAVQGYLVSASFTDAMVGRLIDALDKSGRADKTVIVLWSDHGFHLGEKDAWGKLALWEETTNVPFIIIAPGVTTPGSQSEEAVSTHSIYPTLVELAGLDLPDFVDGTSLVPLLRNPNGEWDDVAITTYGDYGNFTVRDDHYRYIVYANGDEELYDACNDPNEWANLADSPRHQAIKQALIARIPPEETHAPQVSDEDE